MVAKMEADPVDMRSSSGSSVDCTISSFSATSITCSVGDVPAGEYDLQVLVNGVGVASGDTDVTSLLQINNISPTAGKQFFLAW